MTDDAHVESLLVTIYDQYAAMKQAETDAEAARKRKTESQAARAASKAVRKARLDLGLRAAPQHRLRVKFPEGYTGRLKHASHVRARWLGEEVDFSVFRKRKLPATAMTDDERAAKRAKAGPFIEKYYALNVTD
jgi:hypothetical protein